MRVIVCGGRNYNNEAIVSHVLSSLSDGDMDLTVASGGATGADNCAKHWCRDNGIYHREYPADWDTHGKAAGPIRNSFMLEDFKPDMVVAFPGGKGTADMVKKAQAAGVTVLLAGKEFPL